MSSWKETLSAEKEKPYFKRILDVLHKERKSGITIYPKQSDIFNAFKLTSLDAIKVVILGQDPYHNAHQAHGLAFSVQKSVSLPPSLKNIFQELKTDLAIEMPSHGCLAHWAKQGVLLLNTTLTVQAHKPYSHAKLDWTIFTTQVLKIISQICEGIVFLLWGRHAQNQAQYINASKHFILKAPHPSPLSANRGFFGCKHFSKTNALLVKLNKSPIDWTLDI